MSEDITEAEFREGVKKLARFLDTVLPSKYGWGLLIYEPEDPSRSNWLGNRPRAVSRQAMTEVMKHWDGTSSAPPMVDLFVSDPQPYRITCPTCGAPPQHPCRFIRQATESRAAQEVAGTHVLRIERAREMS